MRISYSYYSIFGKVEVIYCDIAQPNQTDIAIDNCKFFLSKGGHLLLVVKSRSIDSTREPEEVFLDEAEKLRQADFKITQVIDLEPFAKDHALIHAVWL